MNKIHSIEKMKFDDPTLAQTQRTKNIDGDFVQNLMSTTAREWGKGLRISPTKTIERF